MARENHGEVTALYRALLEQAKRQIADGNLDAAILTLRDAVAFAPERDGAADSMLRGVLGML
jgi:Flp pilus assembly protein TadD